jgi:Cu(I)/Ag(I) efflux system membrane fusion protein
MIPDSYPSQDGQDGPPQTALEPAHAAPQHRSVLGKLWFITETLMARLRFIGLLVAVGVVIYLWPWLSARYEMWTRPLSGQAQANPNVEFWCPMHPSVVRDHPDKCPICGMPLSQRKKGETSAEEALPPGVVSRVELNPYKVALAGIKTAPLQYMELSKEIRTVGFVEFDEQKMRRIAVKIAGKSRIDKLYANVTGQDVNKGDPLTLLYSPELIVTVQNLMDAKKNNNQSLLKLARERLELWGLAEDQIDQFLQKKGGITHFVVRSPISGHVIQKYHLEGDYVEEGASLYDIADLSTVWIEAQVHEEDVGFLKTGLDVAATSVAFPGKTFDGKLSFVFPHLDSATRTLKVRFDMDNPGHELKPGMYANVSLQVPATKLKAHVEQFHATAAARVFLDRLTNTWSTPGAEPLLSNGLDFLLLSKGMVLAVPETAVIDTGTRQFVYREAKPGVFEGVEVVLGPRCGNHYPLLSGLQVGERVVVAGSFLIDAETRLAAGMASSYLGVSGGPQDTGKAPAAINPSMSGDADAKVQANLARLSPADRKLAEAQGYCPVQKNKLGSMGVPVKILLKGQPVFLCCGGCRKQAFENSDQTLQEAAKFKAKLQEKPHSGGGQ